MIGDANEDKRPTDGKDVYHTVPWGLLGVFAHELSHSDKLVVHGCDLVAICDHHDHCSDRSSEGEQSAMFGIACMTLTA